MDNIKKQSVSSSHFGDCEEKAFNELTQLINNSVSEKYPIITKDIKRRIQFELDSTRENGLASIFLASKDCVDFCKMKGIKTSPGCGSLGNGIISYLLGITQLDPIKFNLYSERLFTHKEGQPVKIYIAINVNSERTHELEEYVKQNYNHIYSTDIDDEKPLMIWGRKTLAVIENTIRKIEKKYKKTVAFDKYDDEKVYCFINGEVLTNFLLLDDEKLKIEINSLKNFSSLEDIAAAIFIAYGMIGGWTNDYPKSMINNYVISHENAIIDKILKSTRGLLLFQEQIIQILHELAGYSLTEAALLSRWFFLYRPYQVFEQKQKFIDKAGIKGCSVAFAEDIFEMIINGQRSCITKSHAICSAMVSYQCAYLKYYYQEEFETSYACLK